MPAHHAGQLVRRGADRIDGGERGAGAGEQLRALGREPHGARAPVQQAVPQLPFELSHLRGDPGLGDVQGLGRGGERAAVDDRDQVAQLMKFHTRRC